MFSSSSMPNQIQNLFNFQVQFNYKYITDKEMETSKSEDSKSITSMDINDESETGSRVVNAHAMTSYHIHPLSLMVRKMWIK